MTKTPLFFASFLLVGLAACGGPDKPTQAPTQDPPLDGNGTASAPTSSPSSTGKPQAAAPSSGDVKKGMAALDAGDLPTAKSSFESAVAANKEDAQAHYYLGVTLNQMKDDKGAEREFKEALRVLPDLDEASANLSALYLDQQRFDDAAATCKAAITKSQKKAGLEALHANYGMALAGKGDQAGAKSEFDLASKTNDAMILLTYGSYLEKWKDADAAADKFRAAAKAAPDDAGVLASIGFELKNVGAFSDCVSTLDRAIAKKDNAEIRTYRALCKLGAKDKDGARADLEAAVKLDANIAPPHFYLAGRIAEAGKPKDAIAEYENYVKLAPQGPLVAEAKKRIDILKKKKK